ncbi:MAG: hypothetical protein Q8936_19505 [Bacillota bacterium]|nr:hypothetical protein [Bacillota bacterium]
MKNKIVISVPIEKYTFSEISSDLARVRINVYHNSYNPNGSFFEDDCFENSAESFKNKPICCAYQYDENGEIEDFKEHNEEEKPIGVVPETNNYSVYEIDELSWASVDGLIFKEYCPEAYELLKEGKKISMEIEVLDGFKGKDKFYHIKQFNLLCITVLGNNYEPAMGSDATIELFSKTNSESFATKFSAIINKANEIVGKVSTEGGKKVKREEIISKFSALSKVEGYQAIIDNTKLSDEDLEKQLFSLSQNQINSAINDALEDITTIVQRWDGSSYESQRYYLVDTIPSENIAIICDIADCDYDYYGVPYVMTGDEAELDFTKMVEYVVGDWRPYVDGDANTEPNTENGVESFTKKIIEKTKKEFINSKPSVDVKETEEYKVLESEFNIKTEKFSELEKELEKVKSNYVTLNSNYSTLESDKTSLQEENKQLKQFKADKEFEFKEAQVNEVLEKYTELQSIDGYDDLIKNKFDCSLDELEVKLKVFAFDNNVTITKKQKFTKNLEKPVDLPLEKKITSENLGDWDILADCLPNK